MRKAEQTMDNMGLKRFAKSVIMGDASIPDAGIDRIDMSTLPDGFDEKESTILGMATVALAWGMDARELFPAMIEGATRADSLLQHIKQRGKTPGLVMRTVKQTFEHKFLPPYLKFVWEFQDESQDRQEAEISERRSLGRERDLGKKVIGVRVAREKMKVNNEITQAQFEDMELDDGRLPDGTDVLVLVVSPPDDYENVVTLELDAPLDISTHAGNPTSLTAVEQALVELLPFQLGGSIKDRNRARHMEAAYKRLYQIYTGQTTLFGDGPDMKPENEAGTEQNKIPPPKNKLEDEENRVFRENETDEFATMQKSFQDSLARYEEILNEPDTTS